MSTNVTDRLDRLESLIEDQQETIAAQQEQINQQVRTIKRRQNKLQTLHEDQTTTSRIPISRRQALQVGGILGLVGIGTGTASASSSGRVGTPGTPVKTVYTDELDGPLVAQPVDTLDGDGLEVDEGELKVTGGWDDAGNDRLEPVDGNINGIEIGDLLELVTDVTDEDRAGNIVAGYSGNIATGSAGGVIAGGGRNEEEN